MHEAEEVSRGLFVARRDAAVVLDSVHETLDQVPFFVQVLVVVSRLLAVALGRNDRLCSVRFNGLDEGVAVIALVGQDGLGLVALQKRLRLGDIRLLPGSQLEFHRQTEAVDSRMKLRGKTATRAAQCLVFRLYAGTPFFAPAACWWARMTVQIGRASCRERVESGGGAGEGTRE